MSLREGDSWAGALGWMEGQDGDAGGGAGREDGQLAVGVCSLRWL